MQGQQSNACHLKWTWICWVPQVRNYAKIIITHFYQTVHEKTVLMKRHQTYCILNEPGSRNVFMLTLRTLQAPKHFCFVMSLCHGIPVV